MKKTLFILLLICISVNLSALSFTTVKLINSDNTVVITKKTWYRLFSKSKNSIVIINKTNIGYHLVKNGKSANYPQKEIKEKFDKYSKLCKDKLYYSNT
jgi:uncharacterized protein YxeA